MVMLVLIVTREKKWFHHFHVGQDFDFQFCILQTEMKWWILTLSHEVKISTTDSTQLHVFLEMFADDILYDDNIGEFF